MDPSLGNASPTPVSDPEKSGTRASKENDSQGGLITPDDGSTGVNKAEAAALVWSKKALYAMYAWYVALQIHFFHLVTEEE